MSLFTDASLVMVPSGYKTSKVYSVKPTDGSGDLTFTRSNDTASRIGPDGLIEKVRTNEVLYSEDLTNAAWTNFSITVGANATTAPNGTTTADKITPTTSNINHLIHSNVITAAGEYSFSVYVKAAGYSKVGLRESQTVGFFASFDLTSGTILDSSTSQTNTITSVGDGWYRITSTRSYSGGINLGLIPLEDSYTSGNPLTAYAGDGTSGIFAWGAQMEYGVPTPYIGPTTSAAVSVGPVANLPRLDYSGGATCPKLLLEPQRTNLALFSEQFDNAAWAKLADVSISANQTTSPDGYTNADYLTFNGSGSSTQFYRSISVASGVTHTQTLFVKYISGTGEYLRISKSGNLVDSAQITFNTTDGTISTFTVGTNVTGSYESYGSGWYRVSIVHSVGVSTSIEYNVMRPTGTGTDVYAIYGAQLEEGAYATSYIPTLGAAVTRGADGAGTSDVFGTTFTLDADFGLYWEGVINGTLVYPTFYSGGNYASGADFRSYLVYNGNTLQLFGVSEVLTAQRTLALTLGTYYKILVKRVGSTIKWYVNGTEYANTTGYETTTVKIRSLFGATLGAQNHESVAQALIFQTTISDAQGIELTTI